MGQDKDKTQTAETNAEEEHHMQQCHSLMSMVYTKGCKLKIM